MTGTRRRSGSLPASLTCVIVSTVLLAVVVGCAESSPEITVDARVDQAEIELVESGASPEVAACVVRLARDDLRVGPIDELTRDELLVGCERAQAVLDGDAEATEPDSLAFSDGPHTLGDDAELDSLWRSCEQGSGAACDELFETAPLGSDYEQFGVSCGDRDELLRCSELDEEVEPGQSP